MSTIISLTFDLFDLFNASLVKVICTCWSTADARDWSAHVCARLAWASCNWPPMGVFSHSVCFDHARTLNTWKTIVTDTDRILISICKNVRIRIQIGYGFKKLISAHLWLGCVLLGLYKVKVKYIDLYSTLSQSASNALPLPISRRWSLQANPTARHQRTLRDHMIRVGVSCDMPVYSPGFHWVLIPA